MSTTTLPTNPAINHEPRPSEPRPRALEGIYAAPGRHWVGDGFHVAGYFSAIPDAARKLDPFLMLDYNPEENFPPTTRRRGVGVHPHRGFETVTFAFQGSVAHHDSTGGGGVIGPGDVQWMTAGAGILHKEYHEEAYARRGGPFQMVQLWVNLPRAHKMTAPHYQPILAEQIAVAPLPEGAGQVRVIAGRYGDVKGPATTFTPINIYDLRLNAGAKLALDFPEGETVALLVMKGGLRLGEEATARRDDFVVYGEVGGRVALEATEETQVLLLNGAKIGEPVVSYGPFVMNTVEEIRQAITDFNAGKFGTLAD